MSKVLVNESSLTGIANAIRGKNGSTDTYKPSEMAAAITAISGGGSGPEIPDSAFVLSGSMSYWNYLGKWDSFITAYADKWSTSNIDNANGMFQFSTKLEVIPFDFNFKNNSYYDYNNMFIGSENLKTIGKLINIYPSNISSMFSECKRLRYLPEFINPNFSRINTYLYASSGYMFQNCYSLRTIPEDFLNQIYGVWTSNYSTLFYNGFNNCYTLDEIRGLNPQTGIMTSNAFSSTFYQCFRLKNIIFALQDDGTPYSVNWKNQTINLITTGYSNIGDDYLISFNSGITADKCVRDDATYQALKDDPDWYTCNVEYSRYNHDSAVATINSLPDTSAYLATAGGTNTIKFKGAAGSATDGGAINTLTEEEIAVATAKGWTCSFV